MWVLDEICRLGNTWLRLVKLAKVIFGLKGDFYFVLFRYSLSPSYATFSSSQQQTLSSLVTGSGQAIQGANPNIIVLKLYMRSLEYQRIYNFPQNGVQFISELGGLMGFFLGMSIISFIECLCFGCCCGCRKPEEDESKIKNVKGWGDD